MPGSDSEPLDHLFRREAGRMVAVLTRVFGVHNLALAEDVVQEALCRALEVWKVGGVPDNPAAWLMTTAKNRALDVLRRERTARTFAPELTRVLESEHELAPRVDELFGVTAMRDDLLRMMFSCCQPRLPQEAQVAPSKPVQMAAPAAGRPPARAAARGRVTREALAPTGAGAARDRKSTRLNSSHSS